MEKLSEKLNIKRFQKEENKTTEWQALGEEIEDYFKRPLYWLIAPYRKQLWYVRQVFNDVKSRKISKAEYFIKILKIK